MPRKGGKAIASGSYGCVFRPALKCKGSSEAGRHSGVSKLMYTTDANDEMDEMKPILETVKRIPGSENFFAVSDINMCSPDSLNDSDKEKFNEKCNLFIDEGINSDSINSNLRDLSIINMPDLGMDLHDYIGKESPMTVKSFELFNKMMINLLLNGVVQMNEHNILHHDLKDTNIMVDKNGNTIIIDWGFAGVSSPEIPVPKNVIGRPIQYNTPFSSMLINKSLVTEYTRVCKTVQNKPMTNKQNTSFLKQFFDYHIKRNRGHETYLQQIIKKMFPNESMSHLFLAYNAQILDKFTNNCTFDMEKYFKEVYIFNVDIWGACSTFMQFLKSPDMLKNLPADMKKHALAIYKEILLDICFKNGEERIDVNNIAILLSEIAGAHGLSSIETKSTVSTTSSLVDVPLLDAPLDVPATSPRGKDSIVSSRSKRSTKSSSKTKRRKKRCPNGYRRHPKTKRCTIMSGPNKGKVIDTPR